jgi:ATP-dependent Lon protease
MDSQPGKIIKSLIDLKSENCVIILDEIDKLGRGSHEGDPENVLLEILDPKQNTEFTDSFLDFPVDLSDVFFICIANDISKISRPLRDRMELVELSSYTFWDKKKIFEKHLYPKLVSDYGLDTHTSDFSITPECVDHLIKFYVQDAGIRSLKKFTSQILQRVAFKIHDLGPEHFPLEVTEENLQEYIGLPVFNDPLVYHGNPFG